MKKRCVITGLGLICGTGDNVDTCWRNICAGKTGIDFVRSVSTEDCVSHVGAEVRCESLPNPEYDRSVRLCLHAAQEAIQDSGLTPEALRNAGVILGSCVGGAASIDHFYTGLLEGREETGDILKMSASSIAANTAFVLGAEGETANIVNACAAGTMSVAYACDLIRLGRGQLFLAGGTDAFSSLAYAGFNALHALSAGPCSPLNHSDGITLGEGAGILVVEDYDHAVARGAKIYCEVAGWGVSSDAFHITAPHPQGEGQISALRRAMVNAGTQASNIGYINAHGTGTAKNDAAEFLSLHTLFDGATPSVSSTKSMTGHCLGAAGAVEAVLSVKALTEDTVPPTTGYAEADLTPLAEKAGNLDCVVNTARPKALENVMSNSFAFGGTNASIIFSKKPHPAPATGEADLCVTGIGALVADKGETLPLAPADFAARAVKLGFYRKLDRFSQMQLLSGIDALRDGGFVIDESNASMVGSTIGTADGPMAEITAFQKIVCEKGPAAGSAFSFPNTVYNAAGGHLSIFTGIKGFCATIANGAQAGLQSVCCACDQLRSGAVRTVLASGTDENSENITDLYRRLGNDAVPGEGSVTLLVEHAQDAAARNARIYAHILGYATCHEAVPYGQAAVSQALTDRALEQALANAGLTAVEQVFTAAEFAAQTGDARAAGATLALARACQAVAEGKCRTAAVLATGWTGCVSCVVIGRKEA